jgi:hypothetical protein
VQARLVKTFGGFTMTKAEALEIQERHIKHYGKWFGEERVRARVAAATRADELPDGEHPVAVINRHIPRGGAIEAMFGIDHGGN